MTASIRSAATYTPAVATNSHVISKPSGALTMDVLIMFGCFPANVSQASVTLPSGWTQLWQTQITGTATGDFTTVAAYKSVGDGEPSSYTFSTNINDRPCATIIALTGEVEVGPYGYVEILVGTPPPSGATNLTNAAAGTSFPTTTLQTGPVADTLVLALNCGFTAAGTITWTPAAGYTEFSDFENTNNHAAVEVAYTTVAAVAGTTNPTHTASRTTARSAGLVSVATPFIPDLVVFGTT